MTDHLPECIYAPEQFDTEQNIVWGWKPCICDALRACEQRVLTDLVPNLHLAEMQGYNRALTAAREAVQEWISYTFPGHCPSWTAQIPAAIDALREKP